ncbi:MAG: ABC transporter ATP-binding protein [Rhodobacteraceae bacterium]|nr:ABC transporter ATP-binding protein [Paracoccaceae bacterium]
MARVDLSGVTKRYGAQTVLDDVSCAFPEGSFTALLGPSGSGKTTLLRIVAGFVRPDAGRVEIGGRDVTGTPVWARDIGLVFQSYALFPHMTVAENVAFGLRQRGMSRAAALAEAARALAMVRLPDLGARLPRALSGGQQQRVALARAIAYRPSVLLLDEPLSALDRRLRQEMQAELRRIQRDSGLTTIFVTHDQEEALTMADSVAILNGGRIVQAGPPRSLYDRPRTRFAATFLGETNILEGVVAGGRARLACGTAIAVPDPLPAEGRAVALSVRPEAMQLGPPVREGDNCLAARVTAVTFAGAVQTLEAETAAGLRLRMLATTSGAAPPEPGASVLLTWPPGRTVLLED